MSTWASRISDLQAAGLTLAEIATKTGMAKSTVGDIATGRSGSPRGEAAVKLHLLHEELCGGGKKSKGDKKVSRTSLGA